MSLRLGLKPKGRVLEMFKGKYDLSPEEYKVMRAYASNDADIAFNAFHLMLPMLSRAEFELWLIDHTLRVYIADALPVVVSTAEKAIKKVEARVRQAIADLPRTPFELVTTKKLKRKSGDKVLVTKEKKFVDADVLASNPQFAQALLHVLKKAKVKIPMKMGRKGIIPALAKNDEGFIALKGSESAAVRGLVIARLAKRSGETQIARLRGLLRAAKFGGFRIYLSYWGASTGRWTGGSGLNPQNFPNPGRSTDDFEREVASLIRACVVPPKGRVFTAVDAANIEARVLAWWAGQQDLVDAFGDGTDVYSEFATESFGEEVRKPRPEDEKVKVIRLKLMRGAGKEAVLGLGYCMGAPTMELRMRSRPDVAPLFASGDLTPEKCEDIVKLYRKKYPKITALWGKTEAAFFKALEGAKRMVNGVLFTPGPKRSVLVTLPSGRVLRYPFVRVGETGHNGRKQWVYGHGKGKKIYGGLLVENIVQAMSRDILAEGIWAMEEAGYKVAYHVHDSIVAIPLKKQAEACMAYCITVLSAAPEWGPGMRLGAEGAIEENFA